MFAQFYPHYLQLTWLRGLIYRKVHEFSDAKKLYCNLPKIQTKRPNFRVFCQNDANGIANTENPDQIKGAV